VLIADDQEMIRSAYRMILDSQPDIQVVAGAPDGATAVDLARRLRPDVCLLDIRMPELDGLQATRPPGPGGTASVTAPGVPGGAPEAARGARTRGARK